MKQLISPSCSHHQKKSIYYFLETLNELKLPLLCSSYESNFMVPWKRVKTSIRLCTLLAQPLKAGPSLVVEFVHLGLSLCPLCCSPVHILLLCSRTLDCIQARLGFSAFSMSRPPPCCWPSTCQCPLEAWGSPAPPVPRPQHSDRARQPVKSHLSAVHTTLETPYTHCSFFH